MDYIKRAKEFRTKKRLGQNFLIDGSVIDKIIETADISELDTVVEIGAGVGFVTERLVEQTKKIYAIELDEDAVAILTKLQDSNPNLQIIHKDVLKTDFSQFGENLKVVANIPYYITSPILVHLLGEVDDELNRNRKSISKIILMVQKEVAQRLVATEESPNKQYGLLSILAQFWCDVKIIEEVGSRLFFPSPKVDSALVELTVRQSPAVKVEDYKIFRRVVKASFATRRKNLRNSLLNGGFKAAAIDESLANLQITPNTRGETLSVEQFNNLAKELKKCQQ